MKLYLSVQPNNIEHIGTNKLNQILSDAGVIVFTGNEKTNITNTLSFERLDGLVIGGGIKNKDAGYLIALSISQKKPILYLLAKGQPIPDELLFIKNNKAVAKFLIVKYYSSENIKSKVADFLDLIENGDARWDSPTVKFTLRITPRIERYLRWKTAISGKTKADWLRSHIVKEIITSDTDYQNFLKSD
jgi:hypothetical protein